MTAADFRKRQGLPAPGQSGHVTAGKGKPAKNHENNTRAQLPDAITQCHDSQPLDKTEQGKGGGVERVVLRIEGLRVKTLDPDNFAGGCKQIIDGLRASGLLLDDSCDHIKLETTQTKVNHFYEEKTIITLEYPEPL